MNCNNPISHVIHKLKRLRIKLKIWNRVTFGNVHTKIQRSLDKLGNIQHNVAVEGDSDDLFNQEMNCTLEINGLLARLQSLTF